MNRKQDKGTSGHLSAASDYNSGVSPSKPTPMSLTSDR